MAKLEQRLEALERRFGQAARLVVVQRVIRDGCTRLVASIDGKQTYQGDDESEDAFERRVQGIAGHSDRVLFVRISAFAGAGMKYGEDDYAGH